MSMTTEETTQAAPDDLPTDAVAFWGSVPPELLDIDLKPSTELPVIDQLGSAPFKKEKGGFPFLGFLASVYEHVSTAATNELHAPPKVESPADAPAPAEEPVPVDELTEPTE